MQTIEQIAPGRRKGAAGSHHVSYVTVGFIVTGTEGQDFHLSRHYVPAIISVHHTVSMLLPPS
jgi:hypothetical protein